MKPELKILKKLHNELTKESGLTQVLELIVRETIKILKADRCTLYVYDPIKKELWSKIVSKLEVNEIRLKIGVGIGGWVAQERQTVNVKEAYNDTRFNPKVDEQTNYKTKSILATPMINPSGQLIGVMEVINKTGKREFFDETDEFLISIVSSISAVAIQQAQLFKSNFELRKYNETIIQRVDTGIVVLDSDFNIGSVNPAFEKIFSVNETEIEGENILKKIQVFDYFQHQFQKLKENVSTYLIEKEVDYKEDIRYFNIYFTPVKIQDAEEPTGHIILINDVTEDIKELLKKKKEENLSLIGKMLTSIVHDIRSPLTSIKGFTEMIELKIQDEEAQGYSKIVSREIDRMSNMVNEILDFARGETRLKLMGIRVSEIIDDLKINLEPSFASHNMSIGFIIDQDFEMIIDPDKIFRAIVNIARNALEAMEPDKGALRIEFKKENDNVIIKLTDNGPGIPKYMLKKVFQPFYTKGKKTGSGLGLSIVKKMIADHKGIIKIWSEENIGTVFTIVIPAEQSFR